jgi:hypothetical protein
MNVRELLQTEIWSKRTTRKLLIGLAVVICVSVSWETLDQTWITPPERVAAKAALQQIEMLQKVSEQDFGSSERKASEAVDVAEKAAWTTRDLKLATTLSGYLDIYRIHQDGAKLEDSLGKIGRQDLAKKLAGENSKVVLDLLGKTLHDVLD